MIGIAALLLLWLEPMVTAIGLAVLAAGLGLHALTRKRAARRGLSRTAPTSASRRGRGGRIRRRARAWRRRRAEPTWAAVLSRPDTAPRSASATAPVPSVVAATDAAPSP